MALHDVITIPSRQDTIDAFVTLLKANATLVANCTPGGIYKAHEVPPDLPATATATGVKSWVRVIVWQLPNNSTPMWDSQTKVRLGCQVVTNRVSKYDETEKRLEIIHQIVLATVVGQKPVGTMLIGYSRVTEPFTAVFEEGGQDVSKSNVEYQIIIR